MVILFPLGLFLTISFVQGVKPGDGGLPSGLPESLLGKAGGEEESASSDAGSAGGCGSAESTEGGVLFAAAPLEAACSEHPLSSIPLKINAMNMIDFSIIPAPLLAWRFEPLFRWIHLVAAAGLRQQRANIRCCCTLQDHPPNQLR